MEIKMSKLKEARKRRKLTVKQAAAMIGVHPMSIYFWEKGSKTPSKSNLQKIKETFGIGASELLDI